MPATRRNADGARLIFTAVRKVGASALPRAWETRAARSAMRHSFWGPTSAFWETK